MKIEIKGFLRSSLIDWDGKIVSTLFVPGCNFRCPFCQNVDLILTPEKLETIKISDIIDYLGQKKGWLDGICLTGGEPCIYDDLSGFFRKIHGSGMLVKLDTNGSSPEMLEQLISQKLVDYVAMDVKAPLEMIPYGRSSGIDCAKVLEEVKKSVKILLNSGIDYEFRTTVVPTLHSEEDVRTIASFIRGARKYALQNFSNQETLDPRFRDIVPYPEEVLRRMQEAAAPYVEQVVVRS